MARYDALDYNPRRSQWMHGQASDLNEPMNRGYDRGYRGGYDAGFAGRTRTYVAGTRDYTTRRYDYDLERGREQGDDYRSHGMSFIGQGMGRPGARGRRRTPELRGYGREYRGGYDPNVGSRVEYEDLNRGGYLGSWSPGGFGGSRVSGMNYGHPRFFTGYGAQSSSTATGYRPDWW